MGTFVVDISALEVWLGDQAAIRAAAPLASVPEFESASARKADIPAGLVERLGVSAPLHLGVPPRERTMPSRAAVPHQISAPAPFSFVRLGPHLYVQSPIAALVQCAAHMEKGAIIVLLNHLLGAFRVRQGKIVEGRPLATKDAVRSYLEGTRNVRGSNRVRAVLPYAVEGVASPAEARVAAMLFTSYRYGGYGLPLAVANAPLDVPGASGPERRYADLFWRAWKLILEYDSDEFHTGADKIGRDSARRAQLQAAGYEVVTLTNRQFSNEAELARVVQVLARIMGRKPKNYADPAFRKKARLLRDQVFSVRLESLPKLIAA